MMSLLIWKLSSSVGQLSALLLLSAGCLLAQKAVSGGSIPSVSDSWTTYNGDYSGRRFSSLTQINKNNVRSLTLAWAYQTHGVVMKSTPLEVNGILYFTVPDHVWAIDAKTGQNIWEFVRPSEGAHIGHRGVAFYKDRIYFGTPDAHLLCLDARDGKIIWDIEVADVKFGYFISVAPLVVKGRIVVGTSGDTADIPHFIEALDWKTGAVVWRTNSLPDPGKPGSETWPNAKSMSRGGGAMWMSGTYDPNLNLIYWGSGNPHPVVAGQGREGDNLYTCAILAVDADTGKITWYFQASPHDTHDWDAVETPVLFDANFDGKLRKLLAQASRNGYFFVLDRETGEHLLTSQFVKTNWAKGIDAAGRPIPNPDKEPKTDGCLIEAASNGGTNWMAPSYDPETKLFYVSGQEGYSYWYLALGNDNLPEDHLGGGAVALYSKSTLLAVDYQTGQVRWRREGGRGLAALGILTTAGHLLFTGDVNGNLLALDPSDGKVLWHTRPGGVLNSSPMTYQVDGQQYVLTGVDSVLYAWHLPED